MSRASTTLLLALCISCCALAAATESARRAAQQKVQASKPEMAANGLAAGLMAAMDPNSANAWSPEEENLAVEILLKRVYKNRLHDGAIPVEICSAVSRLMLKNIPFVEAYRKSSGAPVTRAEKNRFLRIAVSTEVEVIRQGLENLRQQLGSVEAVITELRARKEEAAAKVLPPTRAQINAEKSPAKKAELQFKLATHQLYRQLTVLGNYMLIARALLGEGGASDPFKLGAKPLTVRLVMLALQRLYVKASYRGAEDLFDHACRGVRYTPEELARNAPAHTPNKKDPKPDPEIDKLIAVLEELKDDPIIPPPTPGPTESPTTTPAPSPVKPPSDGPARAQELQEAVEGILVDPQSQTMQKFAVINLLQFAIPTIGPELLVAAEDLSKALHGLIGPTPKQQAVLVRKQTLIRRQWAYKIVKIIVVIHKWHPGPAISELHKLARRLVTVEQLPTAPKKADPATVATGERVTGAGIALTEVPPIPPLQSDLLDIAKQLADALNAMIADRTKDRILADAKAKAAHIQEKIKAGLDPAALKAEVGPALTSMFQNVKAMKLIDPVPVPLPILDNLLAAAQQLAKALKDLVPKKDKQQQQLQAPMEPVQLPAAASDNLLNLAKQLADALAKMVGPPTPVATVAPPTVAGVAPLDLDKLLRKAQQLANAMKKMVEKDNTAKPVLATLAPAKDVPAVADTAADFKALLVSAQDVADALRKVAEPSVADLPQPTGPSQQLALAPVDEVKPTNFGDMLEASRQLAAAMQRMVGKVDTSAEGLDGEANRLMEIAVTLKAPKPATA